MYSFGKMNTILLRIDSTEEQRANNSVFMDFDIEVVRMELSRSEKKQDKA